MSNKELDGARRVSGNEDNGQDTTLLIAEDVLFEVGRNKRC